MADYRLNADDESLGIYHRPTGKLIPNSERNRHWQEYEIWKTNGGVPDPQYTTEEQSQIDYAARQDARVQTLKAALMSQFKMILALFQVGRDKGVWVVADFDPELVTIAQTWIDLINDYESDTP